MSRVSCIVAPPKDRFLTLYQWQIEFCEGNTCAAALISVFTSFHDFVLRKRQHNQQLNANRAPGLSDDKALQDESLYQFHTMKQLESRIFHFAKREKINKAIEQLEALGVVTVYKKNPNPDYRFDKTRYFLFHPEVCQEWLNERYFSEHRCAENRSSNTENRTSIFENQQGEEAVIEKQTGEARVSRCAEISTSRFENSHSISGNPQFDEMRTALPLAENSQPIDINKINKNNINNNIIFNINTYAPMALPAVKRRMEIALGWFQASGIDTDRLFSCSSIQQVQRWVEQGVTDSMVRDALGRLSQHGKIRWESLDVAFQQALKQASQTHAAGSKHTGSTFSPNVSRSETEHTAIPRGGVASLSIKPDWLQEEEV